MPRKLTNEEFLNRIHEIHGNKFSFSDEYKGSQMKMNIHCNKCNSDFITTANMLLSGRGCKKCSDLKATKSIDEFKSDIKKIYGNKFTLISDYTRLIDNITVECNLHHKQKTLRARTFMKGNTGCDDCYMKNGRKHSITTDEFIEKIKNNIKFIKYDFSNFNYINSRTKSTAICDKGHIFDISPASLSAGRGCNICSLYTITSKAMQDIINILEQNKISYIREKTFDSCINKQRLPFDLYLIDYNICIEYDGKQHYEMCEHWGGEKEFISRKNNDKIKTNFCKENNIILYRIRYDEDHVNSINNILRNLI